MEHFSNLQGENFEESEQGQLLALDIPLNALAKIRENMYNDRVSYHHCSECGEEIPESRRLAIKGCTKCIFCKELEEKNV